MTWAWFEQIMESGEGLEEMATRVCFANRFVVWLRFLPNLKILKWWLFSCTFSKKALSLFFERNVRKHSTYMHMSYNAHLHSLKGCACLMATRIYDKSAQIWWKFSLITFFCMGAAIPTLLNLALPLPTSMTFCIIYAYLKLDKVIVT